MSQIQENFNLSLLSTAIDKNLALISFNTKHKVIYVNSNFAHTLNYKQDEMIGMDHSSLCFPSFTDSPEYMIFWKSLLDGKSYQDKIERKNKQGESVWLEATYMPIYDAAKQKVIGVLKVATDITQREKQIRKFTQELSEMAAELNAQSTDGNSKNHDLLNEIDRIETYSNANTEKLAVLQTQAKQIRGIVDVIKQISDQTNILAINAAIEGSHAGDTGRGFVVVAKELQKLSDQVKQSIKQVEEQASSIISSVDEMTQGTEMVQKNVHESRENVASAVQSFKDIANAANALDKHSNQYQQIL
ncbi:methyl-accepting chemotaxis protein [Sporolactobacillus shoreicorticis]|uniref:PAS domain-containing methyl-accepting chemotaxis protein n=1 Tax=Sporolactobacillus shoreicorticis TaxID=1923877 RepID=A0ABW5S3A8_9BACL|nr:methyl-accepting chemotaxis protein [Sporolactobacillus shoreicorticis]MCO7126987.1 methyl-accepting chemotaxis protein [Sporolactobacillus shoreicorticis]